LGELLFDEWTANKKMPVGSSSTVTVKKDEKEHMDVETVAENAALPLNEKTHGIGGINRLPKFWKRKGDK
jgi:hypothetical protein